jgi:ERCC4-type nuclease
MSKRLEDQISKMIETYDDYILIIEGKWNQSYIWRKSKNYSKIKGLQTFLNRMSVEALPVVYTDSKNDTMKYIKNLGNRIVNDEYKMLVRKTTVVKSSRNKYHNIMSLIPGITIDRSKALFNEFDSLRDFMNNTQRAKNVDEKKRWHTQVNKIETFIEEPWGETEERKVIIDKND